MKRMMLVAVIGVALAALADGKPKKLPTKAEVMERLAQMTGGTIVKPGSMQGAIAFVCDKDVADLALADTVAKKVNQLFKIKVNAMTVSGATTLATVESRLAGTKANAAVFVTDLGSAAPALLCAPERHWAIVNVTPLKEGNPSADVLNARIRREIWRGFAYSCGVGNSGMQGCVMDTCLGVKDLDKMTAEAVSPEPYMSMRATLEKMGVTPIIQATYRDACKQGWAPAPTNNYQQAIWDETKKASK